MFKGSKLYSILNFKCPRCHKGSFYKAKHPYEFYKIGKVHSHCSECHLKYEIETGFYQGSYYVTYALGVALFISVCTIGYLLGIRSPFQLFFGFVSILLITSPILYALSKIIWINIFVNYEKKKE